MWGQLIALDFNQVYHSNKGTENKSEYNFVFACELSVNNALFPLQLRSYTQQCSEWTMLTFRVKTVTWQNVYKTTYTYKYTYICSFWFKECLWSTKKFPSIIWWSSSCLITVQKASAARYRRGHTETGILCVKLLKHKILFILWSQQEDCWHNIIYSRWTYCSKIRLAFFLLKETLKYSYLFLKLWIPQKMLQRD